VLYRHDRWSIDAEESGTFWLSDTPEKPASTSWGNDIPRIVTWALFHERGTDRAVYFYNTHWDHRSEPSRRRSARLLSERIAERKRKTIPVIVTGDFNCGESSEGIRFLLGKGEEKPPEGGELVDPFRVLHPAAENVGTFTGFGANPGKEKIDFVLVGAKWEIVEARILRDRPGGRWPSDHLPVSATVRWNE
jgi:endonuclease/exonuclease/phosphatase family metal-dependent hydrolase